MEEYSKFLKSSLDLKRAREQRSKEVSHDTLLKNAKKKIQTTMIGSLSDIEEYFGFLWGFGEAEASLSEQQKQMKCIYEDIRAKILDRGNTQIRELELDFINYDVSRKKYFIELPAARQKGEQNDG
jgi:hypothetical protein